MRQLQLTDPGMRFFLVIPIQLHNIKLDGSTNMDIGFNETKRGTASIINPDIKRKSNLCMNCSAVNLHY